MQRTILAVCEALAFGLLAAILATIVLSGCASMPDKPIVETGQLDLVGPREDWHVLSGLSDGTDPVNQAALEDYDKAQCFKPRAWEEIKGYIHLLEEFGNRCSRAAGVSK